MSSHFHQFDELFLVTESNDLRMIFRHQFEDVDHLLVAEGASGDILLRERRRKAAVRS